MRARTPHLHPMTLGRWAAAASFLAFSIAVVPAAADGVSGLAEKLASLRGEVEQLSSNLARKDAEIRDELKALSRQKTELELELKREQTRIQKVQLSVKERRDRISEEKGQDEEMAPLFDDALDDVRKYVERSLPFRTKERRAELDKIAEQHKQGLLSSSKALSRLWTFVEDEFRLTRESGLYKQAVEIDGQEHLAEVTRIGMVLLYFQVDGQTVGQAVRVGDDWEFRTIDTPEHKKLVGELFESFKKQIRVGLFRLPASLPTPTEGRVPVVGEPQQKMAAKNEVDASKAGLEDAGADDTDAAIGDEEENDVNQKAEPSEAQATEAAQ